MKKQRFCVAILVWNNLDVTKQCIESVMKHTSKPCSIAVLDNGSEAPTREYLDGLAAKYKSVRVFHEPENLGVTKGYNALYEKIKNDFKYIALLNNDIIINETKWDRKFIEAFADPKVALVGPLQTAGRLDANMMGHPRAAGAPLDYLETSCGVIDTDIINKHLPTLYDEKYLTFAYCEDSDFSLRLRNLGYELREVPVSITHLHNVTFKSQTPEFKAMAHRNELKNRALMVERWGKFLQKKPPMNILVIRSNGMGDVLMIEPIIKALKYKYPYSHITVQTNHPAILAHVPYVHEIKTSLVGVPGSWDKIINLELAYEKTPQRHILDSYADVAQVVLTDSEKVPVYNPTLQWKDSGARTLVVNSDGSEGDWPNRKMPLHLWKQAIQKLKDDGFTIVEVGKQSYLGIGENLVGKTSLDQVAQILSTAQMFLGFDGGLMHLAQAIGTPVLAVFGCTCPYYRIHDWTKAKVVWLDENDLPCAGCHHKRPAPRCKSDCDQKEIYCVSRLTPEQVLNTFYFKPFGWKPLPPKPLIAPTVSPKEQVAPLQGPVFSWHVHSKPFVLDHPITQIIPLDRPASFEKLSILLGTYCQRVSIGLTIEILNGGLVHRQSFTLARIQDNEYHEVRFSKRITVEAGELKISISKNLGPLVACYIDSVSVQGRMLETPRGRTPGHIRMEVS